MFEPRWPPRDGVKAFVHGRQVITADFAEIEARVTAWLEANPEIAEVWRQNDVDRKISKA